MAVADTIIAYCDEQIASFKRQVELFEKGELFTGEREGPGPWKDTTAASLEDARRHLAELERIKAEAQAVKART